MSRRRFVLVMATHGEWREGLCITKVLDGFYYLHDAIAWVLAGIFKTYSTYTAYFSDLEKDGIELFPSFESAYIWCQAKGITDILVVGAVRETFKHVPVTTARYTVTDVWPGWANLLTESIHDTTFPDDEYEGTVIHMTADATFGRTERTNIFITTPTIRCDGYFGLRDPVIHEKANPVKMEEAYDGRDCLTLHYTI